MRNIFLETAWIQGQADVSAIGVLAPILAFVAVAFVLGAILKKTEILGDNVWVSVIVSLAVTGVFIAVEPLRVMLLEIVPWFGILLMVLFFAVLLASFVGDVPKKFLMWLFVVGFLLVFLFSGFKAFSGIVVPYLPGPYFGISGNPGTLFFFDWLYSPAIIGALGLIVAGILVSWVLIKTGKD